MTDQDPEVIYSDKCQDMVVDGRRFSIVIVSSDIDPNWTLEIVDETGTSHVWECVFESDEEALTAALIAFDEEGAKGFLKPETNVVMFPKKTD